jgi:hypothetical protein
MFTSPSPIWNLKKIKGEISWQYHVTAHRMRKKIREDLITQKHLKTYPLVPIAANTDSLTECVLLAVITEIK